MIYTASKTRHAAKWRELRASGVPVNATWIDEAGVGETACFADLWCRCISEAASARIVLLYVEQGDNLKGALVEVGAALASGVPVHVVGPVNDSWLHHPLVRRFQTVEEAIATEGRK